MISIVTSILFIFFIYYPEEKDDVTAEYAIEDFDPLVNIEVIFRIDRIRKIDFERNEKPLLAMTIDIDGNVYEIGYWEGIDVYPRWRHIQDVDDGKENVIIKIRLFEIRGNEKIQCDISPRDGEYSEGKTLKLIYSLKNGSWRGDDWLRDNSGYGHAGGYEDGSNENDYEIWFDIYQTDKDGDRLTWYEEVFIYNTNPNVSDYGKDLDNDGVPIEWEDKYGYDPFSYENHSSLDENKDGIQNIEEYMMKDWHSDPFRRDIFVEVDFMQNKFLGHTTFPVYSKEKVISAFSKQNIMLHIDDGLMGEGGEILPYEKFYTPEKLSLYYKKYFLHDGKNEWRRGIFRYCVFAQYTFAASKTTAGYAYWSTNENIYDAFVVGVRVIKNYRFTPLARETAIASLFMHELGHTLGLFQHVYKAIDNASCSVPWLDGWKKYKNYESCMNYRYAWSLVDYSDGNHGKGDFNDWAVIDVSLFEKIFYADREHRRKKL